MKDAIKPNLMQTLEVSDFLFIEIVDSVCIHRIACAPPHSVSVSSQREPAGSIRKSPWSSKKKKTNLKVYLQILSLGNAVLIEWSGDFKTPYLTPQ